MRAAAEERVRRLLEVARVLAAEPELARLAPRLLGLVLESTGAQRGFLDSGGASWSLPDADFRPSRTILERAWAAEHPILLADALEDRDFSASASVRGQRVRSLCVVPLRHSGETVGILGLDHTERSGLFGGEELELLEAVAAVAALVLRHAKLAAAYDLAAAPPEPAESSSGLVGRSRALREVLDQAARVAPLPYPVHLCGESGTGKELLARAIHGGRGPFVPVNCAAIPDPLAESACFGHVRGAFTGADRDQAGFFEQADGGTLFLDEAEAMSSALQEKLLRVLQDGMVRRVGARTPRTVRIRLLSASNLDLQGLVATGRFRADLLYRLDVLRIDVPPLRSRREDIPALIEHVRRRYARETGRPAPRITAAALRALQTYSWPGNVRQLENAVRKAAALATGPLLEEADFRFLSTAPAAAAATELVSVEEHIRRVLREHGGRFTLAELARHLGVSRKTLWDRRRRFGLA